MWVLYAGAVYVCLSQAMRAANNDVMTVVQARYECLTATGVDDAAIDEFCDISCRSRIQAVFLYHPSRCQVYFPAHSIIDALMVAYARHPRTALHIGMSAIE